MKLRRIPIYLLAAANVLAVAGLWITGFADRLDPAEYGVISLGGYAFPVMAAATLAFLPLWVFVKKRFLAISVIGMLVAYQPTTLFFPINSSQEVPPEAFELISYNTYNWGRGNTGDAGYTDEKSRDSEGRNHVVRYLADSGADILCLQESGLNEVFLKEIGLEHHETVTGAGGNTLMVVSRFPITRAEMIPIETKGNVVAAFWLDIKGREVIIVNCHMEVTGLTMADRENFADMIHGNQQTDTMRQTSRAVIGKLLESSVVRTRQAEAVRRFVLQHYGTPVIVCGDFNDIPHSYVHRTIALRNCPEDTARTYLGSIAAGSSKPSSADGNGAPNVEPLVDCYRETAFGPGFSFSHYGMRVRIDNILCTSHLKPYNCRTDNTIPYSDHYPLRCHFTLN